MIRAGRATHFSFDMLGEGARTAQDAQRYLDSYADAIEKVGVDSAGKGPIAASGVSVKLSALFPRYEARQEERVMAELFTRVLALAEKARAANVGLTLDAEEADRLVLSLKILERLASAPALKDSRGAVVNVSSVASLLGTGSSVAYGASKAALNAMTFSLARSLAPEVRVNAVAPGYVDTPWQHAMLGAERARTAAERYVSFVPLKDYARPQDVADAVAWLLEGARQVTGEVLCVDGGMHIAPPR